MNIGEKKRAPFFNVQYERYVPYVHVGFLCWLKYAVASTSSLYPCAIAREFWKNLSRLDLFPIVENNNTIPIRACHERLRPRDGGISTSPPLSYETPPSLYEPGQAEL